MEKNKTKILIVVALVAFAFLIVGATYAYFTAQIGDGKRTEINVTTYTTDVLTFATGDAINLEADQTTFGKDKGSVSGTTYASALLIANNKTNKAVERYYLYLNIENNTFTYSVQDNKPELIMTITDKDGNEVKNIEGLTYTEVTDRTNKKISGYDITTKNGLVTIFKNRKIYATPKAEDKWNITITFVNYEADQNANTGKVLSAKLMIQKNKVVQTVANICKNGQSLSSCIIAMNDFDETLYHHDASLVNGAGDNSYRYSGGDTAHPAYYSCKYNGNEVMNGKLQTTILEGNCDNVYALSFIEESTYVDKSINKIITDKTTIKWDSTNNKCVTINGDDVYDVSNDNLLSQSLCNGYAYKGATSEGESPWLGGIKIEELGPGEETLFTSEDKVNQKPALYSCKYNGIDVQNGEGKINSSLKGDCSSVFKYTIVKEVMYFDKTVNELITGKSAVKWDDANNKCVTLSGETVDNVSDKALCVGEAYSLQGDWQLGMNLEEVGPGEETISTPASEGVHNFVCFGTNADVCPTDNLYRIIGVIDDKVKLIKYTSASSELIGNDGSLDVQDYHWNTATTNNTWSESNLNKINLNTNFINNIGEEWASKIAITTWKVGGNTYTNIVNNPARMVYQNEIVNSMTNTTDKKTEYNAKIGLMYASEFGFAAAPIAWDKNLNDYFPVRDSNWMARGSDMIWTITRNADGTDDVFYITNDATVGSTSMSNNSMYVHPTFNLETSITYKSGIGTISDPILIN